MLISTKGRYSLRLLVDLAEHRAQGFTPLKEIALRQDISEKYLESIIRLLVAGGILSGVRGKGGGYRMVVAPEDCTVGQVLRLTEGPLAPVSCLTPAAGGCTRMADCPTRPVWQELDRLIRDYLDGVTIADLTRGEARGRSPTEAPAQ